jgi:hypothetical protein
MQQTDRRIELAVFSGTVQEPRICIKVADVLATAIYHSAGWN